MTTACLYYFIFAVDEEGNIDDKNYNPIPKFEEDILNKLKPGISDDEVKEVLCKITKLLSNDSTWRVSQKLATLKTLLKTLTKNFLFLFSDFISRIFKNQQKMKYF